MVSRWYKIIQKPFEEGDERGLKLVQANLRPLTLRWKKDNIAKREGLTLELGFHLAFNVQSL